MGIAVVGCIVDRIVEVEVVDAFVVVVGIEVEEKVYHIEFHRNFEITRLHLVTLSLPRRFVLIQQRTPNLPW